MAKKRKNKARVASDAGSLTQSPFAALSALGDALPSGDAPTPVSAEAAEPEADSGLKFGGRVVVRREKKGRGGKTVTRVEGLRAVDLEAASKAIRRALGCGASVEGDDVIVAGAQVERVAEWLRQAGARDVRESR